MGLWWLFIDRSIRQALEIKILGSMAHCMIGVSRDRSMNHPSTGKRVHDRAVEIPVIASTIARLKTWWLVSGGPFPEYKANASDCRQVYHPPECAPSVEPILLIKMTSNPILERYNLYLSFKKAGASDGSIREKPICP